MRKRRVTTGVKGFDVKSPAICLHVLWSGVVVALDDAELENK